LKTETPNNILAPQDTQRHIQSLTHALQGIAGSVGMDPAFVDAPQFFYDYMSGNWNPFVEASDAVTEELKEHNQTVRKLRHSLKGLLPEGAHRQVDEYTDALNHRYTAELDYAYMVGFQTAFRMLLLGLAAPKTVMQHFQEAEKE